MYKGIYNIKKIKKYTIIWTILSVLIFGITFTPIVKNLIEMSNILLNDIFLKNVIGLMLLLPWLSIGLVLIHIYDYEIFSKYLEKHNPEINKSYQRFMINYIKEKKELMKNK